MAKKDQAMEVQKQEETPADEMERTRSRRTFVPRTDIYETEKEIIVLADIPGANEKTVDITLEKNELSITAFVEPAIPSGFEIAYAEYEEGDYQRSFRLSDEIDRDKIEAVVSDGVLRLRLPKAQEARSKKITIKTT
ncbi:MAG: Hsp20/alpha crystallin family protein [Anaerolineales bacterium]|jgi:HSP20 family molecular chaperone IbpA